VHYPVVHDLNEMEGEKSQIFPLPFHSNHVQQDLSFAEELGIAHKEHIPAQGKLGMICILIE